jgi:hypothetical protein
MNDLEKVRKRFLKDNLSVCLGGIASNLARIKSFSGDTNNQDVVNDLIEESKFFIEWTAPKASLDVQELLVNIQLQLALSGYSGKQDEIFKRADEWAGRLLQLSGLVK